MNINTKGITIMSTLYQATAPSGDTVTIEVEEHDQIPQDAVLNLDRAGTIIDTIWIYDDREIDTALGLYDDEPTAIYVRVPATTSTEDNYLPEFTDVYH